MRRILTRASLALLAAAAAAATSACGGGDDDGAASGPDAAPACTTTGFAADQQLAERDDELGVLFYTAIAGVDPFDRLTVDFYFDLGATDAPHTIPLAGDDLADCHTCLLLYRGCSGSLCTSATTFLATSGTLTVSATGGAGDPFTAALDDATFTEVVIDYSTQHAEPVADGETWCLDGQALSATITAP